MKKIICMLLAAASVVSLAACSKDGNSESTTGTQNNSVSAVKPSADDATKITQPNVLLADLPTINGDIKFSNEEKVDKGYIYTYFVDNFDYSALKTYVSNLETAGFSIYNENPLDTEKTEDLLPETLEEGVHAKSWRGKRRGLYVTITWYSDEYYKDPTNPENINAYVRFYTYNIFDSAK